MNTTLNMPQIPRLIRCIIKSLKARNKAMRSTITIVVVIILVILGILLFGGSSDAPTDVDTNDEVSEVSDNTTQQVPAEFGDTDVEETVVVESEDYIVITHTDSGFTPREVTIQSGQTVIFLNESDNASWPASAQHPTHRVYPEQTDNDCFGSTFDACQGLEAGESWQFTFNEVGEWFYHNHLRASEFGKITVLGE